MIVETAKGKSRDEDSWSWTYFLLLKHDNRSHEEIWDFIGENYNFWAGGGGPGQIFHHAPTEYITSRRALITQRCGYDV